MIQFDPLNKRIILDSNYVTAAQIYSRWKEWVMIGDNSKYLAAFSCLGGDPLGGGLYVASYFFLLNGWRIRPMEANHSLTIEGNITVYGGGNPVVQTLGNYNVVAQLVVPVQAQGVETSGGGGGNDSLAIAAAVVQMLQQQMNKIDLLAVSSDGKVEANVTSIADKPLKTWNGSEWV